MLGDQLGDLVFRVIQITEGSGSGWAGLDAGRLQARIDPVVAEVAFLDDRHEGVDVSRVIRTGSETVFAPDASVLVYDHDPVFPFPRCLHRTIDDAGRMVALIAKSGEKVACDVGVFPLFNNLHP